MPGETDLAALLRSMEPSLHPEPHIFCSVDEATYARLRVAPRGLFREAEGVTLILPRAEAQAAALPYDAEWAWITLNVHSALDAIGFIAAVSRALTEAGVSTNAVAGYYHDHVFVQWAARERAMEVLRALSERAAVRG